MQVTTKDISTTSTILTVTANQDDLAKYKTLTVNRLSKDLKLPGFRTGKVPPVVAEKNLDANHLQSQVIEEAINHLYLLAINETKVRVVARPNIAVTKFVPYTELVFTAQVDTIGKVNLPDYKNIKIKKDEVKVTDKDIEEVLQRLQQQAATYTEVDRAAKNGDRVFIDFDGKDAKGQPIKNASGKEYPLTLGSKSFIEGFEEQVVGLKKGDTKSFNIAFPKDYFVKLLAGQKVTFDITVKKVEDSKLDELDDAFAAKIGPFKTIGDLKADIRKQLNVEQGHQAANKFEEAVVKAIALKTKVNLPTSLIDEQMDLIDKEFRQNLSRRGETFEDYLTNNAKTESDYKDKELRPLAEERLKAGLVLAEIAQAEKVTVNDEELKIRIQVLKNQYKDAKMQAELDKPENQRDIASRMVTEKTIAKLVSYLDNE